MLLFSLNPRQCLSEVISVSNETETGFQKAFKYSIHFYVKGSFVFFILDVVMIGGFGTKNRKKMVWL